MKRMPKPVVTDATLGNWRRTARWRRLLLAVTRRGVLGGAA